MTSKTRKVAAFAAILLSLGTVTAYAASRPPLVGVTKSSMNGVNRASGAHGALKANAVGNRQIKFGSVSCGKLSADLVAAICTGKPGAPGTPGAPGANGISGSKGDNGSSGGNGSKGDGGSSGASGHDGSNGSNGKDASVAYGVAQVLVQRGTGAAAAWATYSTRLGSPVGDTTSGTFRFSCSDAQAPCKVTVKAAVLQSGTGTTPVYPRVLIQKQDYNAGGPSVYCEYGDGSTGANAAATDGLPAQIANQPSSATPTYTAMQLNIGGSADCGVPGPASNVDAIIVPAGRYDVQSTFAFLP